MKSYSAINIFINSFTTNLSQITVIILLSYITSTRSFQRKMAFLTSCWLPPATNPFQQGLLLTLLHSEWPKLHRVLALLSAIGLRPGTCFGTYANRADPVQTPPGCSYTAGSTQFAYRNFYSKYNESEKSPETPKTRNGHIQMIKVDKSTDQKRVQGQDLLQELYHIYKTKTIPII